MPPGPPLAAIAPPRRPILGLIALGLGILTAAITLVAVAFFVATAGKFKGHSEGINDGAAAVVLAMFPVGFVAFSLGLAALLRRSSARGHGVELGSPVPGLVGMLLGFVPLLTLVAGVLYYVAAGGAAR